MTTHTTRPRADAAPPPPRGGSVGAVVRLMRPKQWVKNVLVLAAPAASGQITEVAALTGSAVAFVAFCLAASGTYCINDAMDVEGDRAHPSKRHRPVAAGQLSLVTAWVIGVVLLAAAVAVSLVAASFGLTIVIASYVAATVAYSLWLKHVPTVELAAVASGFVLRAIAGGFGADIALSEWFLIVTSFGALCVVFGKRHAELLQLGTGSANHRAVLGTYTLEYLRGGLLLSSGVAVMAYCLWAFGAVTGSGITDADHGLAAALSVIPFTLAVLRYLQVAFAGDAGAPDELILRDRTILILGVIWAATVAIEVLR